VERGVLKWKSIICRVEVTYMLNLCIYIRSNMKVNLVGLDNEDIASMVSIWTKHHKESVEQNICKICSMREVGILAPKG